MNDYGIDNILLTIDVLAPNRCVHNKCIKTNCLQNQGEICLTDEYKRYLENQYKIKKEYSLQGNDWDYALNPRYQDFLALTNVHRMRYKKHQELGERFISQLFYQWSSFCEKRLPDWNISLDNVHSYKFHYNMLSQNAHASSLGEIYRLYDLYAGADPKKFSPSNIDFLALIFAMGIGENLGPPKPKTLSQFVANFEFFKQFGKDCLDAFKKDRSKGDPKLLTDLYLGTTGAFKKARELWLSFSKAADKLFSSSHYDHSTEDASYVQSLKSHLAGNQTYFPYNFSCKEETVYHPFKHKDIIGSIPDSINSTEHFLMVGYIKIIREVILNGTLSADTPPRPDQFGEGRIFTFEKECSDMKMGRKKYKVLLKRTDQQNTVLLTCVSERIRAAQ